MARTPLLSPAEYTTKLRKGSGLGIEGRILYLLPASQTLPYVRRRIAEDARFAARIARIFNVNIDDIPAWLDTLPAFHNCPGASAGCIAACLVNSGYSQVFDSVNDARAIRTLRLGADRAAFMRDIVADLEATIRKAQRENLRPVARLNGTSDIAWHTVPVVRNKQTYANVFEAFPDITFYDYTKRPGAREYDNYRLTFSLSEDNDRVAYRKLLQGINVAVVLALKPSEPMPASYHGFPVIDGDKHDWRFLDPRGVVVGLRAKALAKTDTSGFVREPSSGFDLTRTPNYPALTYHAAD